MKIQTTIQPIRRKKIKLVLLTEAQLLKDLTAKNAHADEIANINNQEFDNHEWWITAKNA